jgi:hypothetical protein
MGRARRVDVGDMIYHALNRANFRSRRFRDTARYADFLGIVEEGSLRGKERPASRPGKKS